MVHWIRRLLIIGLPMGLQFSLTAVGSIVLQTAVNGLGSAAVAAMTAGGKVSLILTQPMESIGLTMATYCGQNLGAGKIKRIHKGIRASLLITMAYAVLACLAAIFAGGAISRLFLNGDNIGGILEQVKFFLLVNGLFYPFLVLIFIFRNSLQGLGSSLPAMTAGIFELVGPQCSRFLPGREVRLPGGLLRKPRCVGGGGYSAPLPLDGRDPTAEPDVSVSSR